MADNTQLAAASGGDTIATDDIGGVKYPRSKISLGADGSATDAVGGAGAVSSAVMRTTLASDDPAVTALQLLDNAISGAGFNVTQLAGASVPIGTGLELTAVRVTLATDSTGLISIDDNGGSLTIDGTVAATQSGTWTEANSAAIKTAVEILDNAISGSEMQVDVVAALPAGTNNIGDVDVLTIAAGDNNIGNVDIVTVPADPFGVNADVASATGSISAKLRFIAATGIPITGTVTVGTHAVTQSGTWTVDLGATDNAVLDAIAASVAGTLTVGSHAVTNAGTFAVQAVCTNAGTFAVQAAQSGTWNITNVSGTVSLPTGASTLAEQQSQTTHLATIAGDTTDIETAVELIDDTVATLGTTTYTEASTKGLIIGAVRRDADTTLVDTTNEIGPVQMNAAGQLKVEVFSGESLPVTLTSTTVTGTVAVTQSGTWDEVGINDSGNSITVDWAGTSPPIGAGVEATALRVTVATDSTGVLSVDDNGVALTVDNAGTFAVQVDGSALTALQLIDNPVVVDDAVFTPATTSVMMAGFQADETATDSIDEGDAGAARMTLDRKQYVVADIQSSNMRDFGTAVAPKFAVIDAATSGDNTLVAAVASKKIRVVSLLLVSAGTVTTRFESGAGGTALTGQMNLVANSGFSLPFNPAGWFETAVNTLLNLELSGAISTDGCLTYIEVA